MGEPSKWWTVAWRKSGRNRMWGQPVPFFTLHVWIKFSFLSSGVGVFGSRAEGSMPAHLFPAFFISALIRLLRSFGWGSRCPFALGGGLWKCTSWFICSVLAFLCHRLTAGHHMMAGSPHQTDWSSVGRSCPLIWNIPGTVWILRQTGEVWGSLLLGWSPFWIFSQKQNFCLCSSDNLFLLSVHKPFWKWLSRLTHPEAIFLCCSRRC